MSDSDQVIALIKTINRAWTTGDLDALDDLFHDEMTIATPGFAAEGHGKAACVDNYREFLSLAEITSFKDDAWSVKIFEGDTAIVHYKFEMRYRTRVDAAEFCDVGDDLYVLKKNAATGEWRSCWRTNFPSLEALMGAE